MAIFTGIVSGIALIALGVWILRWLGESGTKSWIISSVAWSLILYGVQVIIVAFIGNPFKGLI
ncbi:MAG: hypothetical protein NTZ10_02215 [Candidatus Saganbacteria bacterium]|nr:hypothetical protein [Candidatus Saganbacteria bacterium]